MIFFSELLKSTYSTAKTSIQHFAEFKCFVQDNLYIQQHTTFFHSIFSRGLLYQGV